MKTQQATVNLRHPRGKVHDPGLPKGENHGSPHDHGHRHRKRPPREVRDPRWCHQPGGVLECGERRGQPAARRKAGVAERSRPRLGVRDAGALRPPHARGGDVRPPPGVHRRRLAQRGVRGRVGDPGPGEVA